MLSYDWIVMITLGLDRWDSQRTTPAPYEIDREEARKRYEERLAARPPEPSLLERLFIRRPVNRLPPPPRPARPHKPASRA